MSGGAPAAGVSFSAIVFHRFGFSVICLQLAASNHYSMPRTSYFFGFYYFYAAA